MPLETDAELDRVLDLEAIAVVGCSSSAGKAAHDIPRYLTEQGYEIIPVNPYAEEIFGKPVYDSVSDVDKAIDIVNVFRPSDEVPGIVDRALERDDVDVIWMQLGIEHDGAARRAEDDGRDVVQNRCMKVEHQRLRS